MNTSFSISGNIIDLHSRTIFPGQVLVEDGIIKEIKKIDKAPDQFILPGFVDSHIHIESSMLVPYEFARTALRFGTVATVSDPHEIANVLGVEGVEYMIENARDAKLKFHFGAPSCVPATSFETSGAHLDSKAVIDLLKKEEIYYLSEMMNYPGVLFGDEEVMKKIEGARELGMPVDGHAPGLRGEQAKKYIDAGISTDHECFTYEEALDKLNFGMKVIIREGSAAKNYPALHPLIRDHADRLMYCSDDKHPDDLLLGHINELVVRSLKEGYELFDVLRMACLNPVEHYKLNVGLLRAGDPADFIVVESLENFKVLETYIDGELVADIHGSKLPEREHALVNNFAADEIMEEDLVVYGDGIMTPVIVAIDGELITKRKDVNLPSTHGKVLNLPEEDILKIVVMNRYKKAPIAKAFIHGFGLKNGALASTVAHDSHNIIAVGANDKDLCKAINLVVQAKGGLSVASDDFSEVLPLPIAGLISPDSCEVVGQQYARLDEKTKELGSQLRAPFMTLSFMALLVIPSLKLSDLGLFDGEKFEFV